MAALLTSWRRLWRGIGGPTAKWQNLQTVIRERSQGSRGRWGPNQAARSGSTDTNGDARTLLRTRPPPAEAAQHMRTRPPPAEAAQHRFAISREFPRHQI